MRKLIAAASIAFLSVPALAADLNLLGGAYGPGDVSKDACSWSRPHIVFENNSKTRIRVWYAFGKMDQETKDFLTYSKPVIVEPGKEVKEIFQDQDSIVLISVHADSGKSDGIKQTRMDFHNCPSGTKGELSNNFPAWKFLFRKDESYALYERKK